MEIVETIVWVRSCVKEILFKGKGNIAGTKIKDIARR